MKKFRLKYISEGQERTCEMFGESEADIRSQFKRFGFFTDCYITFLVCDEDERTAMLNSINSVLRAKQFSLN